MLRWRSSYFLTGKKSNWGASLYFCHYTIRTMALLYNLLIRLYVLAVAIAGIWNKKAREWTRGRKGWQEALSAKISPKDGIIWVHCASAGELEQGKPIIEQLKAAYPSHKILISFFSPSGYAVAKKYGEADVISYLPADTKRNAKRFMELVRPQLAVFIKYEFWYHHLKAAATREVPLLLASALFRKDQVFFKWYGKFFRQMLFLFRHIFVQDEASLELLKTTGIVQCSISGDTRFDRVKKIADHLAELPLVKKFAGSHQLIVAGSTWPEDEKLLSAYAKDHPVKFIIAPHEIQEGRLEQIEQLFPGAVRYSTLTSDAITENQTLIIDNMGMLSRIYHYATIAYVGGGFNKSGIHNMLEAGVYGKAIVIGPHYKKFKEARDLVALGGACSISNAAQLGKEIDRLLSDDRFRDHAGALVKKYVEENTGATKKLVRFIQENRLLTS
jgi:3-deoxy-D-manno-octulosonic-acid transferase